MKTGFQERGEEQGCGKDAAALSRGGGEPGWLRTDSPLQTHLHVQRIVLFPRMAPWGQEASGSKKEQWGLLPGPRLPHPYSAQLGAHLRKRARELGRGAACAATLRGTRALWPGAWLRACSNVCGQRPERCWDSLLGSSTGCWIMSGGSAFPCDSSDDLCRGGLRVAAFLMLTGHMPILHGPFCRTGVPWNTLWEPRVRRLPR